MGADVESGARDHPRGLDELESRIGSLRGGAEGEVGPSPADERSRRASFRELLPTLEVGLEAGPEAELEVELEAGPEALVRAPARQGRRSRGGPNGRAPGEVRGRR